MHKKISLRTVNDMDKGKRLSKIDKSKFVVFILLMLVIPGILYIFKEEYFYSYIAIAFTFGQLIVSDSFLKLKNYNSKIEQTEFQQIRVSLSNLSISFLIAKIILDLFNFRKIMISIARYNTRGLNWILMGKTINIPLIMSEISQILAIWFAVILIAAILELIENQFYKK